jgi:hypothetical protein
LRNARMSLSTRLSVTRAAMGAIKHMKSSGGVLAGQGKVREILGTNLGRPMDACSLRRIVRTVEHRDAYCPTLRFLPRKPRLTICPKLGYGERT